MVKPACAFSTWTARCAKKNGRVADRPVRTRRYPKSPTRPVNAKLTDLSLGGCYVQTESPFPQSSAVDLCLRARRDGDSH